MSTEKPTAFIFCDKRHVKKNGKVSIKLYVDYLGTRKSYKLPEDINKDDWDKIQKGKKIQREDLKELKSKIFYYSGEKFDNAIREIEQWNKPFSFSLFENYYFGKQKDLKNKHNIFDAYDKKINRLEEAGRTGSANTCTTSKNSLKSFSKNLNFVDITTEFLNNYEEYLLNTKNSSITTVGFYMRELRAIINEAISDPVHPIKLDYPFSRTQYDKKYKIPKGENVKKALSLEEIDKIKTHKAATQSEQKAIDFWLFSYFCNGINIADIANLKFKNIESDYIIFNRKKTARTKKDAKLIRAYLNDRMKLIIKHWGTKNNHPDDYIFPILQPNLTPEREHQLIKQFTKWVNGYLHTLSTKLSLSVRVTTYHARHSYATTLKRNGVAIAHISDSLGHTNLKTTENYLDGFTDDKIKEASKLL